MRFRAKWSEDVFVADEPAATTFFGGKKGKKVPHEFSGTVIGVSTTTYVHDGTSRGSDKHFIWVLPDGSDKAKTLDAEQVKLIEEL